MMKLDILSDPICPWCYIGKHQLEKALAKREGHPFDIEWHPFQLNPDMVQGGMDRREYLENKFGGKDRAVQVYGQIDAHAKSVGLELNLSDIKKTPNTVDAHRVIYWAHLEERQNHVVDALFKAYFVDGQDIGDHDVLIECAMAAGLDGMVVKKLLSSDQDIDLIKERDAHARSKGVNSVPTFIVANQHAVPGAQPPDLWLKVIDEAETLLANDGQ